MVFTANLTKHKDFFLSLIFYNKIVTSYSKYLKKDGFIIFEIGYDQADDLINISKRNGFKCEIFKDYGGNDRVAILRFSND